MALPVRRIVNVSISLSPMAAQRRGFGILGVLGDSAVIGEKEGYRSYLTSDDVLGDFGADAPETLAAQAFFSQSPKPQGLVVFRWFNSPTAGTLQGGAIEADFTQLQVAKGGFKIAIDGAAAVEIVADLHAATNLAQIASALTAALAGAATVTESNKGLLITSAKTGVASDVGFASAPDGEGVTDLSALLGFTEAAGAVSTRGAQYAETLTDAVSRIMTEYGRVFYGLITATSAEISDDDRFSIAQAVESSEDSHIYGITLNDSALYETPYTDDANDIASKLKRGQYTRTIVFYTPFNENDAAYKLNPYFAASALGRMFSVNFSGSKTTITLKFKQAPSIQPVDLSTTPVNNLEARNVNVYAIYENDTYIIEPGVMASGMHADERHGLDWLKDAVQTGIFNVLYQSKTKIMQKDDDVGRVQAAIEHVLQQAVKNGLLAPGQWNSDSFGSIEEGDYLDAGYYVYADSVNNQDQSEREARKSPPFQIAAKLAGAIESVDVMISVNR